jgi:hypothetical protein
MLPELRKVVTYDEEIRRDGDRPADPALRMIGVAAVVRNPRGRTGLHRGPLPRDTTDGARSRQAPD